MITILIAIIFVLALCGVAIWANARFRDEAQLPMQWWFNGEVTWFAPRPLALAFIPALALPVFASAVLLPPRPGQEGMVLPAVIGIGATLIILQRVHIWLIEKTLGRNPN